MHQPRYEIAQETATLNFELIYELDGYRWKEKEKKQLIQCILGIWRGPDLSKFYWNGKISPYFIYLFVYLSGLANFTDKIFNTEKERRIQDTTLKQYND